MTSKVRIAFATLGVLASAGLGCGGDGGGPAGPSASNLIGTWDAVKSEMVSDEDPSQKADLLGSSTLVLRIYQDHTWESLQTYPEGPPIAGSGTWSLSGTTLTITPQAGYPVKFKVSCDGSSMTLTQSTTWDYDVDGTSEPATITMGFVK